MKSNASTVEEYLDALPSDRREAISNVRGVILGNLDKDLRECMQYGVIGYCVPHSIWTHGHHTRPELPLMYMGLSSQKNDMVVYMLCLFENGPMRAWFEEAWKAAGKRSYLEVSGMGCCLRFKRVEDLALEVIGEAMRRLPVKQYLEDHVAMLAKRGKGPDGKPLKKGGGRGIGRGEANAKVVAAMRKKPAAKKKSGGKSG